MSQEALTTSEAAALKRYESVIAAGKTTFVAVGQALTAIRENRLYRSTHETFEAYCQEKWGWSRQRASQMIQASAVVKQLPESVSTRVDNEKTARVLAKVPEEKRAEVVEKASKNGQKVTPKSIKAVAEAEVEPAIEDVDKIQVPTGVVPLWLAAKEDIGGVLLAITRIKSKVQQAMDDNLPHWRQANCNAVVADLGKVYTAISAAKPYAVCPQCQGHPEVQKCRLCLGVGYVGKFRYQATPKTLLEVRKKTKLKK